MITVRRQKSLKIPYFNHFTLFQFNLPLIHQKNTKALNEIEFEKFQDFWIVDDMFTFENIGFSNTVEQTKFLICADCEMVSHIQKPSEIAL
jgi:predicted alpha/beta-fold hydrolase